MKDRAYSVNYSKIMNNLFGIIHIITIFVW